jgi:hypothetical protein
MYREAEIGCRRGWKQDLWEARSDGETITDEASGQVAAAADPNSANYWIDQSPRLSTDQIDIQEDRPLLSDDDLLNPRGTRNAREAMRRAREARKRELNASSRRDPSELPTFTGDAVAGEDSVIEERPIPFERPRQPLVPPVSLAEVRKHVEDARRAGRHEAPLNISFRDDDTRFTEIPELPDFSEETQPEVTPQPRYADSVESELTVEFDAAENEPVEFAPVDEARPAPTEDLEIGDDVWEDGTPTEPWGTVWADQAPWPQDDVLLDAMPQPRQKRRGFLGSLLHRREAAAGRPIRREEEIEAWEAADQEDRWSEPEPWTGQPAVYAESDRFTEPRDEVVPPRHDQVQLPPLPYDAEEGGEDYLLADSTFGERDDDDAAIDRMPRICQTCRYLRPGINGPTCGAVYAQTYRRIVDLKQLSCASSIGAWWLPSDEYWESRVDISHHGEPTPLLDQFAIRMNERETDDDLHTT